MSDYEEDDEELIEAFDNEDNRYDQDKYNEIKGTIETKFGRGTVIGYTYHHIPNTLHELNHTGVLLMSKHLNRISLENREEMLYKYYQEQRGLLYLLSHYKTENEAERKTAFDRYEFLRKMYVLILGSLPGHMIFSITGKEWDELLEQQ